MKEQISPERPEVLDFRSAAGLPPEEAAFYYLGPSEVVTEGVIFFSSQSNCTAFLRGDRILLVDTSGFWLAPTTLNDLRSNYSQAPVDTIVYTQGHIDHCTGAKAFLEDASSRGHPRPRIIGHRDIPRRFQRYRLTAELNDFINSYQFTARPGFRAFSVAPWIPPDILYDESMVLTLNGERFELYHARGETDDETWVWCPNRRVLCTGDCFIWATPNAGNPYKVQRYALDWATALEKMAALRPLYLVPGHGPVISGEERVQDALLSTAAWLRSIHDQVVTKMNEGKWLEDILREIQYPPTDRPWLRPIYDHPEFVARNVYRLYGGWYDGNPANILPAHSHDVARELVEATGSAPILARARELRDRGELKLACHLVDFVRKGEPGNREAWELWRELFAARAASEPSIMARGAFNAAVLEAEDRLKELDRGSG